MAHLTIRPNEKRERLVELTANYLQDLNKSHDDFEKAEIGGFIMSIMSFCVSRAGFNYWYDVLKDAKNR